MNIWYIYTLMALGLMGGQRFLYKVAAEKRYNTAWTAFAFMTTVAVLSSIIWGLIREPVNDLRLLFLLAFVNSSTFLAGTVTHIEALKYLPTAVVYPVIRLNVVIVVVFSILFFQDDISGYQITGIVLAIGVILILTCTDKSAETTSGQGGRWRLYLVFIAMLCGSIAGISSKFAAIHTSKLAFMALSYIMSMGFALVFRKNMYASDGDTDNKGALKLGVFMGCVNFAGYYCFLKALSAGPLSVIASIVGMHFVIAILLSVLIYKETVPPIRIAGIVLSLISILLMRL